MKGKLVNPHGYSLSGSQKKAKKEFRDWFNERKSLSFTLSGSAGTGKTWLVKDLLRTVVKNKRVVVSAPTHKAVRVIENFTNTKGATIHSLHGLRPNFNLTDFNINNVKFQSMGVDKFNYYDLIILDESSMISADLHRLNMLRATQYNTRILYIGDKLQLAPVGQQSISEVFNNTDKYNLTEIIRQQGDNPLLALLILLRDDVTNNTSTFLNHINKNKMQIEGTHGYNVINLNAFVELVKTSFASDEFENNINSYRVATYTNDGVNFWNRIIRNHIINSPDLIAKGDKLMGYKTIVNEYFEPIIINSNDYVVKHVDTRISDDGFKVFDIIVQDYDRGFEKNIYVVDHTDKSFTKYYLKLCELHRNALYADAIEKGKFWKAYYHYKDTFMTMIDFALVYNNKTQGSVKREIDYAYAVTIHKLQGSTIDNIFLDAMNICYYNSNKQAPRVNTKKNKLIINNRNRLLYTGLSRAKNIGFILYY